MSDLDWDTPTNAPLNGADKETEQEQDPITGYDLRPSWSTAMSIYLMVLESGTEIGKREARNDLLKLAKDLDDLDMRVKK